MLAADRAAPAADMSNSRNPGGRPSSFLKVGDVHNSETSPELVDGISQRQSAGRTSNLIALATIFE